MIRIENKNIFCVLNREDIENIRPEVLKARETLESGTGKGNDFLGWITLPESYDREEFARIKRAAEKIRSDSDVLICIGIGGSCLGAEAAIEALSPNFGDTRVVFCGNNMSTKYTLDLTEYIKDKDFSINVISKSGTTTEPAIAFRYFKELIEKRYGKEEAAKRIYATTDKKRGALKQLSDAQGYETFVVPDDIGGRYSVLTAVGLLPIAAAGIDIDTIMDGARSAQKACRENAFENNNALLYAAYRNALYRKGKKIEMFVNYEPSMHYISEWWKQLFGESEGKDNKGIFPAAADFTTDLHSMGQYIQQGERIMFETVVKIENWDCQLVLGHDEENLDGLNYLEGKTLEYANMAAMKGTVLAHTKGGVANIRLYLDRLDAFNLGELFYTLEYACAVSGYTLGVNPFDQPGVEAYKKNMFAILGKPGYTDVLEEK